MKSSFESHKKRWTRDLAGFWDFTFLGDIDPDGFEPADVENCVFEPMMVPGCFDALPAYAGKRGTAVYRHSLDLHEGRYRLYLDGAQLYSRVWVNGRCLGNHVGGFTRFFFDFQVTEGRVEIMVLVNNTIDYRRNPLHLDYFDWYHYGGIARSVEVHRIEDVCIENVAVETADIRKRLMRLNLELTSQRACALPLSIEAGGKTIVSEEVRFEAGRRRLEFSFELPDVPLWSPENPHLEILAVHVGNDDYRERFGIRKIECRGKRILLNEKEIELFGFNRHESHPQFGCALPPGIMMTDLHIIKDLGCNFIRGSHYPQDARFLDLCDELGILVWCEAVGWQHTEEHLTDPHFLKHQKQNITEMISGLRNHPSVIMWGLLNESWSHSEAARPGYRELISHIRTLDESRPVTYATNHYFEDLNFDLVDIVSFNCYPGWYRQEIGQIPEFIESVLAHIDDSGYGDKPVILSEIGAGALFGFRDWNCARWSEEYQAALLEKVVTYWKANRKRLCGLALWQFCDCRASTGTAQMLGRPRGFNNKGIVDEWRRPKHAYNTVKRLMT